jgi:hypothetical protein
MLLRATRKPARRHKFIRRQLTFSPLWNAQISHMEYNLKASKALLTYPRSTNRTTRVQRILGSQTPPPPPMQYRNLPTYHQPVQPTHTPTWKMKFIVPYTYINIYDNFFWITYFCTTMPAKDSPHPWPLLCKPQFYCRVNSGHWYHADDPSAASILTGRPLSNASGFHQFNSSYSLQFRLLPVYYSRYSYAFISSII